MVSLDQFPPLHQSHHNSSDNTPGRWFKCKRGLRQGDPLSPYFFIIVADVLKQLIGSKSAMRNHPIIPSLPCPILQYVDDTLILLRGSPAAASTLKDVLDDFAAATGQCINYHKSTFIPVHMDENACVAIANILGCPISSFPQPYLGLPLSATKLRNADFHPLIAKCDKYLAGWEEKLLSNGGRLVLTNAILSSLPVYWMSSLFLPNGVIDAIDRRRRALLALNSPP